VCPFDCIVLRTGWNIFLGGAGMPQIYPLTAPCVLCLRCTSVCPSQAILPVALEEVKMGQSRLNREVCFTWTETLVCRTCFERCPKKGQAIVLKGGVYPSITLQCAGCGTCEYVCPAQAIITIPSGFEELTLEAGSRP
jgi:ferredoxin